MNKNWKVLIWLLLSVIAFSGCKKYTDDDKRYFFKSPQKRLSTPGSWKLFGYYINGADSSMTLFNKYSSVNSNIPGQKFIVLAVDGRQKKVVTYNSGLGHGSMELIEHKERLRISITSNSGWYNPFINEITDWDIKELTIERLTITGHIGNDFFTIKFRN